MSACKWPLQDYVKSNLQFFLKLHTTYIATEILRETTMNQDYIPFQAIIDKLEEFCNQQSSGILFIATKANRSAQIVLENGKIVFIYFYNKRGTEALKLMLTIEAGRYRFQKNATSPRRSSLPSTDKILRFLNRETDNKIPHEPTEVTEHVQSSLNDNQKRILETVLAEYIGPMATIICEDHLDSAPDMAAAIDALASEIPSPDQAQKFRTEITANLK